MIIRAPSVLVFKEKHDNRYFYVTSDEALFAAALHVLAGRHADGYWYTKPAAEREPAPPDVTREQIDSLPESLRAKARENLRDYRIALQEYTRAVEVYDSIVKAIEEKNGRKAWEILSARGAHEYEGCTIARCETVTP